MPPNTKALGFRVKQATPWWGPMAQSRWEPLLSQAAWVPRLTSSRSAWWHMHLGRYFGGWRFFLERSSWRWGSPVGRARGSFSSPVLALRGPCTGPVLAPCTGRVLDSVLPLCLHCIGRVLALQAQCEASTRPTQANLGSQSGPVNTEFHHKPSPTLQFLEPACGGADRAIPVLNSFWGPLSG
jgi:hypothetical protein